MEVRVTAFQNEPNLYWLWFLKWNDFFFFFPRACFIPVLKWICLTQTQFCVISRCAFIFLYHEIRGGSFNLNWFRCEQSNNHVLISQMSPAWTFHWSFFFIVYEVDICNHRSSWIIRICVDRFLTFVWVVQFACVNWRHYCKHLISYMHLKEIVFVTYYSSSCGNLNGVKSLEYISLLSAFIITFAY